MNNRIIKTIQITRDGKSNCFSITKTDNEGFHHTLFVTLRELEMISIAIKTLAK